MGDHGGDEVPQYPVPGGDLLGIPHDSIEGLAHLGFVIQVYPHPPCIGFMDDVGAHDLHCQRVPYRVAHLDGLFSTISEHRLRQGNPI